MLLSRLPVQFPRQEYDGITGTEFRGEMLIFDHCCPEHAYSSLRYIFSRVGSVTLLTSRLQWQIGGFMEPSTLVYGR